MTNDRIINKLKEVEGIHLQDSDESQTMSNTDPYGVKKTQTSDREPNEVQKTKKERRQEKSKR